jgi:ubiquinone/menaquinone biosynthesis C-methylase UbiE
VASTKGHRGFAALWDFATKHESAASVKLRRDAATQMTGNVLEIGFGVGTNWQYLPAGVQYTGIDPDSYMVARARKHASAAREDRDLRQARGEKLPFDDATFDSVLCTFTLCSVGDQRTVIREVQRVMRPGGTFAFAEHVRPGGRVISRLTDGVAPAWRRLFGGCNPNRRTGEAIAEAGFEEVHLTRGRVDGLPHVWGTARKSAGA